MKSGLFWCSLYCDQAHPNSRRLILWSGVSDANHPLLWPKTLSCWAADREAQWGLSGLLLSVLLTVPPFVERFQQHDDPCRIGFYALAFISFVLQFHKWVVHTTSFWFSNVASLATFFDMYRLWKFCITHKQGRMHIRNTYAPYIYTGIYKDINRKFSFYPQVWGSLRLATIMSLCQRHNLFEQLYINSLSTSFLLASDKKWFEVTIRNLHSLSSERSGLPR